MRAVAAACAVELEPSELAVLGQVVENRVAAAPCGIMDQMTAACGRGGHLLRLLCQPAVLEAPLAIPPEVALLGISSGARHAVSGSGYSSVRTAASMGYTICARNAGLDVRRGAGPGRVRVADPLWSGYLANIPPEEFAVRFAPHLPERMRGDEFLERCGGVADPLSSVDADRTYRVLAATAHPIEEHARARAFTAALEGPLDEPTLCRLGEAMLASHRSYGACGLGSPATDRLVDLVRAHGPRAGLYGARVTGGGLGGTVAVIGRRGSAQIAVQEIAAAYRAESGAEVHVFRASSPRTDDPGTLQLRALRPPARPR